MNIKSLIIVLITILPFIGHAQNIDDKFELTSVSSSKADKRKNYFPSVKYNGKHLMFLKRIECNDRRTFIITSYKDRYKKKCFAYTYTYAYTYAYTYNREISKVGPPQKIVEIDHVPNGYSFLNAVVAVSPDNSKIAVILDGMEMDPTKEFTIVAFNDKLEKINEQTGKFPHREHLIEITSAQIDDIGNVYALGKERGARLFSIWADGSESGIMKSLSKINL